MALPKDPFMLMSMINMKLRDGEFENLEDLCKSLDLDMEEVISTLKHIGYSYNENLKQFR